MGMTKEEAQTMGKAIMAKLQELGDTVEAVTANLRKLEVRGKKNNCRTCPIAVYIDTCGFTHPGIIVVNTEFYIYAEDAQPPIVKWGHASPGPLYRGFMPPAVRTFIQVFDHYDHLADGKLANAMAGLDDSSAT